MENGYVIARRYRKGGYRPSPQEDTVPVDTDRMLKAYRDLERGADLHPAPCLCPSCCFTHYRAMPADAGRPFDRLTFFLDWLETPARLSLVKGAEEKYDLEKPGLHPFIRAHIRDFLDVPSARVYREMARLMKRYLPKVAIRAGSIKVRLWRFGKSGMIERITKERQTTPELQARWDSAWDRLRRASPGRVQSFTKAEKERCHRLMARLIFEWQPAKVRERFNLVTDE